jgi:ferredoxin
MKKNNIVRWIRWIGLAAILAYVTHEFYLHQKIGGLKASSVHALCPYGALESFYNLLFAGAFIQKIFVSAMIMLVLTVVIAVLFRRSFCGLICPFGALQEFFAKLGKLFFKKRPTMPSSLDKPLRFLKYLILILTLVMAWKLKGLWMSPYDPYAAYSHIFSGFASLWAEFTIGTILLVVTILGSIVYDRFFCKYLCPMGGFLAIIGRISPTRVVRDDKVCIHCNKCTKVCPVNIDVAKTTEVKTTECISCNECVNVCPKEGAIALKFTKKTISPITTWIVVLVIFFGSIFITQKLGWYSNVPKPLEVGETLSIEEIRGFMSLADVASGLKMDIKELYTKLEIPESVPPTTKFKELSTFVPGMTDEKAKEILEKDPGKPISEVTKPSESSYVEKVEVKEWLTEPPKEPAKEPVILKGYMPLSDIAKILNISIEELFLRLKLPSTVPPSTILKQVSNFVPGFDFEAEKEKLMNNP